MKLFLFSSVLFCFSLVANAQKAHPHVKLVEEKNGKRLNLFAENSSDEKYLVFLRIVTSDFRRAGDRPVLTEIEPHSKIKLITLIKLEGAEGNYDATFIVNNASQDIRLRKDTEDFEIKIDDKINHRPIQIYTDSNCSLCKKTKFLLNTRGLNYNEYFSTDTKRLDSVLLKHGKQKKGLPILIIEDSLYNNITTEKQVIDALDTHYKK